jgi:hypothetical protein
VKTPFRPVALALLAALALGPATAVACSKEAVRGWTAGTRAGRARRSQPRLRRPRRRRPARSRRASPSTSPCRACRQRQEHRLRHDEQRDDALDRGFKRFYPNVEIATEGAGSGTAPPALSIRHRAVRPMSRPMKDDGDRQASRSSSATRRPRPDQHRHARRLRPQGQPDQEPDAAAGRRDLLSKTRRAARPGHPDLGRPRPHGEWAQADQPLRPQRASGTYGYFKEHALFKGDYKDTVKEQPGSSARRARRRRDKYAIGYSGIGYKTADVRAVPLASDARPSPSRPWPSTPTRRVPARRFLYLYVNSSPAWSSTHCAASSCATGSASRARRRW